jgi:hypothetical protein
MPIRVVRTETGFATRLFCDQCGERIEEARAVVAASAAPLKNVGDSAPCAYVHVGPCDVAWRRRVPRKFQKGWDTAEEHFGRLLASLGLAVKISPRPPAPKRPARR